MLGKLSLVFLIHGIICLIAIKLLHYAFYPMGNMALFCVFFAFSFVAIITNHLLTLKFMHFSHFEVFLENTHINFQDGFFKISLFNIVGIKDTIKIFWLNILLAFLVSIIIGLTMSWLRNYMNYCLILCFAIFYYSYHKIFSKNTFLWFWDVIHKSDFSAYDKNILRIGFLVSHKF